MTQNRFKKTVREIRDLSYDSESGANTMLERYNKDALIKRYRYATEVVQIIKSMHMVNNCKIAVSELSPIDYYRDSILEALAMAGELNHETLRSLMRGAKNEWHTMLEGFKPVKTAHFNLDFLEVDRLKKANSDVAHLVDFDEAVA